MTLICDGTMATDWFGSVLAPPANFHLSMDEKEVFFRVSRTSPSTPHPLARPGQFFEGLWEYDVAEIFFADKVTGRYLEINLAPHGAWWACWHSDVRRREIVPAPATPFEEVIADGEVSSQGWQASLRLPLDLLPPIGGLRFNISFILNSPQQTFHSLANLAGDRPDFHQPELFLPFVRKVPS